MGRKSGNARKKFSSTQKSGKSSSTCPLKPCNLKTLKIVEPLGGDKEKKLVRTILIPSTGSQKLQITANSRRNGKPREITLTLGSEATCSGAKHPLLTWSDSDVKQKEIVGNTNKAGFYRQTWSSDSMRGWFSVLNAAFSHGTESFIVRGASCGRPSNPSSPGISSLITSVEVFPGDLFQAELSIPAIGKAGVLDKKKGSLETQHDRDEDHEKEVGKEANKTYDGMSKDAKEVWGPKKEFRKGIQDIDKKQHGYTEDPDESGWGSPVQIGNGCQAKLTQRDGNLQADANVNDVRRFITMLVDAKYAAQKVEQFIEHLTSWGVGASAKIEFEFLVGKFQAEWGYKEYTDWRVFMKLKGSFVVELIKASIEFNFGFQAGGMADLFAYVKGEGAISFSIEGETETPDDDFRKTFKPKVQGELKPSVGLTGKALWCVSFDGHAEVTFKAETKNLHVFRPHALLSGSIEPKREEVVGVITADGWLWGTTTHNFTLFEAHEYAAIELA